MPLAHDEIPQTSADPQVERARERVARARAAGWSRLETVLGAAALQPSPAGRRALAGANAALHTYLEAEEHWFRIEVRPLLDRASRAAKASLEAAEREAREARAKPGLHRRYALLRELQRMDAAEAKAATVEALLCAERGNGAAWEAFGLALQGIAAGLDGLAA